MASRPGSRWLLLAVAMALFFAPRVHAQGKVEQAARALEKKAMEQDYLASEFVKAEDKLEKAITRCGADRCSAVLRARLRRDLGVVQIGSGGDREKGIN